jgi:Domain of unknown function (DUF5134)
MGMTGPGWLGWLFAVVMLGTAAYCAGRLAVAWRSRRPTGYAVDLTHVLMGTAMAGMLVPELGFAPAALWQVTFAATGCWFAVHAVRSLTRGRAVAMAGQQLPDGGFARDGPAVAVPGPQRLPSRSAGGGSSRGGQNPARSWPSAGGHAATGPFVHLLACGAMLIMLAPPASRAASAAMAESGTTASGGALPVLATLCAVGLLASVVLATDRLTVLARVPAATPSAGGGAGVPMSPRLAACCDIAVGVTMGYLLILMIA